MSHFTEISHWQAAKPYEASSLTNEAISLNTPPDISIPQDDGIQALRARLKEFNAWPAAGDTFVSLLAQVRDNGVTLLPSDYDWLTQVADDARKGEDIGFRYPSIFQKLLTFAELRQQFMLTL